ncbi:NAD(P)-dependent oxidoreductase [Amaricoccus solimangrovi]|uniref:Hydroxyacid dehydrogenase n=1 Tax=Amaricoccus solimangrovi TaxID=2589815 RepID=A0A501WWW2_9RHOB|nr:NAD(P)-dependent oxidoreductase [Amaricoccus solimangrovi]TPE51431.1 hydroxyacid dehydrogenase [Amaricoccus solimangrovi]
MTLVLTTSPAFGLHGRVPARLAELGWEVARSDDPAGASPRLAEADFLVAGLAPVTADWLARAPRLRGVLKHGTGTDNIDIPACSARGVPVLNAPGANAAAVAELSLGLLFALAREIPLTHAETAGGAWNRRVGAELAGATLGIVGLGRIGKRLASAARALGMEVVATDPVSDADFLAAHPVGMLPLAALLARADYVALHLSGTTRVLGAAEIAAMKPGARLLNLARGEVIDLDALTAALARGHLAGAAIDVYTHEPPDRSHPIFADPKVIFTPHAGGNTLQAVERIGLMNIADIETLLAGGRPARVLNPQVFGKAPS